MPIQKRIFFLAFSLWLAGCSTQSSSTQDGEDNIKQEEPTTPGEAEIPEELGADIFSSSEFVGRSVDARYSSENDLMMVRSKAQPHKTDSCEVKLIDKSRFVDMIGFFSAQQMTAAKAPLSELASDYGLPSRVDQFAAVSLMSHSMCKVTSQSLAQTLTNVPSAAVIAKANQLVDRYNAYRAQNKKTEMHKLWGRLFMCMAYVESLTTADTNSSKNVGDKYAPANYRKPAGVKFYEDPAQPAASRLNIGLFQFTPNSGGNIFPCISQWNNIYPSCQISKSANQDEMIRALGSSGQAFNSFCGVNKVQQTFSVQVNTKNSKSTHPENKNALALKPSVDRCVSLHFRAGLAYNHFGPLQNSTGRNLEELLDCTLAP